MSAPPITANLTAWYQFSTGITSASGLVSQWNDQTANANHLVQATGTNQPALQSDNSILFDGVDNFLKASAFTLNIPVTIYLLMKQVTWTGGDTFFDGNTVNLLYLQQLTSTPRIQITDDVNGMTNDSLTVDVYAIVTVVADATAASILQVNNTATTGASIGANNLAGFTLGVRGDNVTGASNIQVKEVIIYSAAHDAGQRGSVVTYLQEVQAGGGKRSNWRTYRSLRGRR